MPQSKPLVSDELTDVGKPPHTAKYVPWKIVVVIGFEEDERAFQFQRYLKTGSALAFANKHFF